MRIETVKVINPNDRTGGYMIVNKSDYDGNVHHEEKNPDGFKLHEANEVSDPNVKRGVNQDVQRNASGTYSTPTPTDVRYPDKDATEFENNHGAFLGGSAAELRDATGMEDRPGGVDPEQHEKVEDATAAAREVAETKKGNNKGGLAGKLARRVPPVAAQRSRRDR